jgi:hypothetical protein
VVIDHSSSLLTKTNPSKTLLEAGFGFPFDFVISMALH